MNEFLMICERIVPEIVSVLKEQYVHISLETRSSGPSFTR